MPLDHGTACTHGRAPYRAKKKGSPLDTPTMALSAGVAAIAEQIAGGNFLDLLKVQKQRQRRCAALR